MVRVNVRLESGLFNQAAFHRSLVQAVTRSVFAIEGTIKRSIQQGSKTGRVYRRAEVTKLVGARRAREFAAAGFKRSRDAGPFRKGQQKFVVGFGFHRASAPGEAPASDSTHLVKSIKAETVKSDASGIHGTLSINAAYGRILEEQMNRPYIAPAIAKEGPKFQVAVDRLVARAAA